MLNKRVTTEACSNSETKIWHWRYSILLKSEGNNAGQDSVKI